MVAFLAIKVLVLAANLRRFPTLAKPSAAGVAGNGPGDAETPRVALLIPVRNETARLGWTLRGLLTAGFGEVIFLDDVSTDGSAHWLVTALDVHLDGGRGVTVVTGRPRPPGWVGKTLACGQLAQQTTADILVFCDSDVQLAAGAAGAVVAELDRQSAAVLSVFACNAPGHGRSGC